MATQAFTATLGAAICLLCFSIVGAQTARPVCDMVSEQEAIAILGSLKQKNTIIGDDQCVFTTEGLALMINRLRDQEPEMIQMMMDVPKNRAREGDVVTEESGLGQRAVSEKSGGSISLLVASGSTFWSINVSHVYNKDQSERLPKLRELARKLVGGGK